MLGHHAVMRALLVILGALAVGQRGDLINGLDQGLDFARIIVAPSPVRCIVHEEPRIGEPKDFGLGVGQVNVLSYGINPGESGQTTCRAPVDYEGVC
jgi:hypothetical protein